MYVYYIFLVVINNNNNKKKICEKNLFNKLRAQSQNKKGYRDGKIIKWHTFIIFWFSEKGLPFFFFYIIFNLF